MSGTHHLKDKKICSPCLHRGICLNLLNFELKHYSQYQYSSENGISKSALRASTVDLIILFFDNYIIFE